MIQTIMQWTPKQEKFLSSEENEHFKERYTAGMTQGLSPKKGAYTGKFMSDLITESYLNNLLFIHQNIKISKKEWKCICAMLCEMLMYIALRNKQVYIPYVGSLTVYKTRDRGIGVPKFKIVRLAKKRPIYVEIGKRDTKPISIWVDIYVKRVHSNFFLTPSLIFSRYLLELEKNKIDVLYKDIKTKDDGNLSPAQRVAGKSSKRRRL